MNCPFCNAIVPKGHTQCCFCGEKIEDVEVPQTAVEMHENESEAESSVQVIDELRPSDETALSDSVETPEQDADLGSEDPDVPSERQQENTPEEFKDEYLPQSTKNDTDESMGNEQEEKGTAKSPKKKKSWLLMVALFLCGVIVGALLLGGISKNRAPSEKTSGEDTSHLEMEPENKIEGTEESSEQETDDDAEDKPVVERIDEEFAGVWGKYYANDDGTLQYDENGEMIFTGDLVIIDPDNDIVYELYEDNTVSSQWMIREEEQSDEFTFWADPVRLCYVWLVENQCARELSFAGEEESINRFWIKIDEKVPDYDLWKQTEESMWNGIYNMYGSFGGDEWTWYDDASCIIDVGEGKVYYTSGEYSYEYTIISVDDTVLKCALDEGSDYVWELTRIDNRMLSKIEYATEADGTKTELGEIVFVRY